MSLLTEALKKPSRKNKYAITNDDVEIALEWARRKITLDQVQYAYQQVTGKKITSGSNLYLPLARALREYIIRNNV